MIEQCRKHNISYVVPQKFLHGETDIACPLCDVEAQRHVAEIAEKIRYLQFITLFRDTWAECIAFRTKQKIERSGGSANWTECLETAQAEAAELFHPLISGAQTDAVLPPLIHQFLHQFEMASNNWS